MFDYSTVTEEPGVRASCEQLDMMYTRYRFAVSFCEGKDVLEIACGSGQGLGYLGKTARRVVGGDLTESLLSKAQQYYRGRVGLLRLDAHVWPFKDHRFDLVLLYEAIYYLTEPKLFLFECRRVLRDKGAILICTVNKEWSDFNTSPFSVRYFSARELATLLKDQGFDVEIYGAFPVDRHSFKGRLISLIKRTAIAFHLIPKTMKGKRLLKRVVFGKLLPLPSEVEDRTREYVPPKKISCDAPCFQYKVLYAIARVG